MASQIMCPSPLDVVPYNFILVPRPAIHAVVEEEGRGYSKAHGIRETAGGTPERSAPRLIPQLGRCACFLAALLAIYTSKCEIVSLSPASSVPCVSDAPRVRPWLKGSERPWLNHDAMRPWLTCGLP